MRNRLWLSCHLQDNVRLYILVTACFLTGTIMGALVLQYLYPEQLAELASFLDVSLAGLMGGPVDQQAFIQKALGQNLRFLLSIGFLGLTVVGIPLVLAFIVLRGFMLGFTVGFLISEKAGAGILLAGVAILPQNLFYIPAFIIAGALATGFSFRLVKGRQVLFPDSLWENLLGYLGAFAVVLVLVGVGGLVESYFTPLALRWLLAPVFR